MFRSGAHVVGARRLRVVVRESYVHSKQRITVT